MFCVYHMMERFDELVPQCDFFEELELALAWSNSLRDRGCRFVIMASEVEGNVTKMGAAGMDAKDYEWKKRR